MNTQKTKLLFITQKIHENDDDLAFVILWLNEFVRQGIEVQVICLEKREYTGNIPVFSLGKEQGKGKIARTCTFLKYITTLHYNRVFVHMNPEYYTLGGWYWFLTRKPVYLWYTHYTMHIHLRIAGWISKRMFAATKQSLPQYEGTPKKVILGHGIDVDFWLSNQMLTEKIPEAFRIASIHRICRSKRIEISIQALKYLPQEYSLDIYGRDVEKDYYQELQELVKKEKLESRVCFKGPVPMSELKNIYPKYRLLLNLASETIDKTMLEAMLFGLYPVTTRQNSIAIGLPCFPENDEPETLARFIQEETWKQCDIHALQAIVKEKHSLQSLIQKMGEYIKPGI
jgi:glycosyltransferase involved in cell wall biosynthesis